MNYANRRHSSDSSPGHEPDSPIPNQSSAYRRASGSGAAGDSTEGDIQSLFQLLKQAMPSQAFAIWVATGGKFTLLQEEGMMAIGLHTDPSLQIFHEKTLELVLQLHRRKDAANPLTLHEYLESGFLFRFWVAAFAEKTLLFEVAARPDKAISLDAVRPIVANMIDRFDLLAKKEGEILDRSSPTSFPQTLETALLSRLHLGTELVSTAYRIANEACQFFRVDRCSVARFRRERGTVLAVSGISTIDRRAQHILALEELASAVGRSDETVIYPSTIPIAPQIESRLNAFIDETGSQSIWAIPLHQRENGHAENERSQECIGVVIIERYQSHLPPLDVRQCESFLTHVEVTFSNAVAVSRIPGVRWALAVQPLIVSWESRPWKILTGLMVVCATIAFATLYRVDFHIEASGSLEPHGLQHVFAPWNGEIVKVPVRYRTDVAQGDTLLIMRSPELDLRKEELTTQRSVTLERLRGIEALRLRDRKGSGAEATSTIELSANERELRETLTSQDKQLQLLQGMLQSLTVRSPSSGTVITWNPQENLARRPVQQGQRLLSIADLESDGTLNLQVLEEDIRHIVNAAPEGSGLPITFAIGSDPGKKHAATLEKIGTVVEIDEKGISFIRVESRVRRTEMENAAPFARVVAKIQCGRASIGYVWTRRLIDLLQFYFS